MSATASVAAAAPQDQRQYEVRRHERFLRTTGRPEAWESFGQRVAGLRNRGRRAEARALLEERFGGPDRYVAGRLLVKYREGATGPGRHGLASDRRFTRSRVDRVRTGGRHVLDALLDLAGDPDVEYAEPDYLVRADVVPNDTDYVAMQWDMRDIGCESAWATETGSTEVVVGVIDSGGDQDHPDLLANYWTDGGGKTGWNAITNTNDPEDDKGHGTHVAGTVGAVGNNGMGVAGVVWRTRIMNLKFLPAVGSGTNSDAIELLEFVLARKAEGVNIKVTNNSWSGVYYSQALYDAIKSQMDSGILFVASASNDGQNIDRDTQYYPACYDLPNIVTVLNYGINGETHSSTNYGWQKVHIGAPGQAIWSTTYGDTYSMKTGTSMAAPHVTGALAMLFSTDTDMDWREAKDRLLSCTTDTLTMDSMALSNGKLNLVKLLANDSHSIFRAVLPIDSSVATYNAPLTLRACWYGPNRPANIAAAITITGSDTNLTLTDDGVSPDIAANDGIFSAAWTPKNRDSFLITYTANAQARSLRGAVGGGNTWYLNDTSLVGDSWCTAIGSDGNDGQSPNTPMRNWAALQEIITNGDTVLVDAGVYYPTAPWTIGFNYVTIRGKDSAATQIFFDTTASGGARSITAYLRDMITISDLSVSGGFNGIYFSSSSRSFVRRCRTDSNGFSGIYLFSNSESNLVEQCAAHGNGSHGFSIAYAESNLVVNNYAAGNTSYGFNLDGGVRNTFTGNIAYANTMGGFLLTDTAQNNTLTGNLADSNGSYGFRIGTSNLNTFVNDTATNQGLYGFVFLSKGDTTTLTNCVSETNNQGFRFEGGKGNTINGGRARGNTTYGAYLYNGSTGNTLRGLDVAGNSLYGFYLATAPGNTIEYCTTTGNLRGFQLSTSSNDNLLRGNTVRGNNNIGIYLLSSNGNSLIGNNVSENASYGLYLDSVENSYVAQNTFDSNTPYEIFIANASAADTFLRNNILPSIHRPDSGVRINIATGFQFLRNWWGTTDSISVAARVAGTGAPLSAWLPWRLGMVDTGTNADTVAPAAPDTVVVAETGASTVRLTWAASTLTEDGAALSDLAGYRVYRSRIRDTSLWAAIGTTTAGVTTFTDSGLANDTGYHYRITAYDTASPWPNESFYSDSIVSCTTGAYAGPVWYVSNDTGNDAGSGDTAGPFKTITRAHAACTTGQTIRIHSGTYAETVLITKSGISLIGSDSRYCIVDVFASNETAIVARNVSGIRIANLQVIGAQWDGSSGAGIHFDNVDSSFIESDSCGLNDYGIILYNGSESNSITNCLTQGNVGGIGVYGIAAARNAVAGGRHVNQVYLEAGADTWIISGVTIASGGFEISGAYGVTASGNTFAGGNATLGACTGVTLLGNTFTSGKIVLDNFTWNNTLSQNIMATPNLDAIEVNGDSNTISGNTITGGGAGGFGIKVEIMAETNLVISNTMTAAYSGGIRVTGPRNSLIGNTVRNGAANGGFFVTNSADSCFLQGNTAIGNTGYGFAIERPGAVLIGNTAANNTSHGFQLFAVLGGTLLQNSADSNGGYGLYIFSSATPNNYDRNNLVPPALRPDSALFYDSTVPINLGRTWWGTTDSTSIYARINGAGKTAVVYTPWRLGFTDTTVHADTIAPAAPDTVAVSETTYTTATIRWAAPTLNEDGSAIAGLAGHRVYRARTRDSASWDYRGAVAAGALLFTDSGLTPDTVHFYRVTSYDNRAPWPNESFYSDSVASCTPAMPVYSGPTWYVAADTGSDTGAGNGSGIYPFRSIGRAMTACVAGDTIRLYAGTYAETVVITKDTVSLIGAGPTLSVIVPGDSTAGSALIGIFADTQSGILIRDLGVRAAYRGIALLAVTQSLVDSVIISDVGDRGLYLLSGADTNIISRVVSTKYLHIAASNNNRMETCTADGFKLSGGSQSNTLSGNTAPAGNTVGFNLTGAHFNQLVNNTCTGSATNGFIFFTATNNSCTGNQSIGSADKGFYIMTNSDSNVFGGNTALNNFNDGFLLSQSSYNVCTGNVSRSNLGAGTGMGFYLSTSSVGNTLTGNMASGNLSHGFYLANASNANTLIGNTSQNNASGFGLLSTANNFLAQNTADSNSGWAVTLEVASTADTFFMNNFLPSVSRPESGVWNATATTISFTRNWWGTTDSSTIASRVLTTGGGSVNWSDFRLGVVDTAAGADTVAPSRPDTVAATVFAGGCTVTWSTVTLDEDGQAVAGLAGYHVFRALDRNASNWGTPLATHPAGTTAWADTSIGLVDTYYYRVTAYDNHAPWPNESFYSDSIAAAADSSQFKIFALAFATSAAGYATPDTPLVVSATVADTIWFNPTGVGAAQVDTITVFVSSNIESQVVGSAIFTPIRSVDTGFNKDSYTLVYRIDTGATSASLVIVATAATGSTETALLWFEADSAPPTTPVLATPAVNHETNVTTIRFRWGASTDSGAGLMKYQLQVDTSGAFTTLLVDSMVVAITETVTLAANDTYFWRVIAHDSVSNSAAASLRRFTIDTAPPTTPNLFVPFQNHDTTATTIRFSWTPASDALSGLHHYQLQIDTANVFASLVVDSSTGLATFDSRILPANDTYFWRVLAVDAAGCTAPAVARRLRVDTAPPTGLALVAPVANTETTSTTIVFSWTAATDALTGLAGYRLQIDTNPAFAAPRVDSPLGATSLIETHVLPANDTWYWRVGTRDTAGNEIWTPFRSVAIDTRLAVSLAAPADSATQDTRPVFQWSGTAVDTYRWQISTLATFATIYDSLVTSATAHQPAQVDSGRYYWRVVAWNRFGSVETTVARYLVVDTGVTDTTPPNAFDLASPATGAETCQSTVTFRWNPTTDSQSGIASYLLQISRFAAFTSIHDSRVVPGTASETVLPLAGNDTYYWRVMAADNAGCTRVSTSSRWILVDTQSPTLPALLAPTGGGETAVTSIRFRWSSSTDTLSGLRDYRIQIARNDSTFATTVLDVFQAGSVETTPNILFSTADTWYWRVLARDEAGCTSGWTAIDSFRRLAPSDTIPPDPVQGLDATTNTGATVTLTWGKSPSAGMTGGGQYNIYWDNGTGTIDLSAPLAIVPHTADTVYAFTTGLLPDSRYYSFVVRAQDSRGIENTDTAKILSFVRTASSATPMALIKQATCGQRLLREEALVTAEISPSTQLANVDRVIFQFRADTTSLNAPWKLMQTLTLLRPNPATTPAGGQFSIHWDLQAVRPGNTAVPAGLYQVRAVVFLTDGRWDTMPEVFTVFVVDNNPDRNDTRLANGNYYTEQKVFRGASNTAYAGSDSSSAGVRIPENALIATTDTLRMTLAATASGAPSGKTVLTSALTLTLGGGQTALGGVVTVWLSYADADSDGIVDGTTTRAADLELWHLSGGAWLKCDNISVDTVLKRLYGTTTSFSEFVGVGGAAAANLANFKVAPNPFRPNDGNVATGTPFQRGVAGTGIWFLNLPNSVRIEIYTISGRKVTVFSSSNSGGSLQWDARNDENREVASGYYLYVVTDFATGGRATGKLTVIR